MKTEQQRIDGAIDTALLNADLLREQVAELEQALLAETQAKHEAVAMLLIDDATASESGDWDIEPIPAAIEKLARSGGATLPLYTTPQPAPTAAPSRDVIRATLVANGFTIKEGQTDLKPYVYEAVEALFAKATPTAAQDVAGLEFTLVHPADGEKHTVTLTREEVQEQMADELYEKLGELICHCEPVGETNVVDCNCIDRIEGFEIVSHQSGGWK